MCFSVPLETVSPLRRPLVKLPWWFYTLEKPLMAKGKTSRIHCTIILNNWNPSQSFLREVLLNAFSIIMNFKVAHIRIYEFDENNTT